jgi:hypothetical protein
MRNVLRGSGVVGVVLGLSATGCSSGASNPDLSASSVTSIPNGTGTGTAASGTYSVEIDVTACSGACSTTELGVPVQLCTTGSAGTASIIVVQSGGHLTAQATGNLYVNAFAGGINADGSFDIGGLTEEIDGASVTVTSRAEGTVVQDLLSASVVSEGEGTVNGSAINCEQTAQIAGMRTGS